MKYFTKRQIMDGEVARQLYKTLIYPSTKNFRWAIQSHKIKNCTVAVHNVDEAIKIWEEDLDALKVNTTWIKPNIVARDQMKVPIKILKLHQEVFLTADIIL